MKESITEIQRNNHEFIKKLVDGSDRWKLSSPHTKDDIVKMFFEWKEKEKNILTQVSFLLKIKIFFCRFLSSNHSYSRFQWFSSDDMKSREHNEVFLENVFTEPYPSGHDTAGWALSIKMADIFTWKGISVEESKNYFINIDEFFVNHDMVQGIILFNIYKLKK